MENQEPGDSKTPKISQLYLKKLLFNFLTRITQGSRELGSNIEMGPWSFQFHLKSVSSPIFKICLIEMKNFEIKLKDVFPVNFKISAIDENCNRQIKCNFIYCDVFIFIYAQSFGADLSIKMFH